MLSESAALGHSVARGASGSASHGAHWHFCVPSDGFARWQGSSPTMAEAAFACSLFLTGALFGHQNKQPSGRPAGVSTTEGPLVLLQ